MVAKKKSSEQYNALFDDLMVYSKINTSDINSYQDLKKKLDEYDMKDGKKSFLDEFYSKILDTIGAKNSVENNNEKYLKEVSSRINSVSRIPELESIPINKDYLETTIDKLNNLKENRKIDIAKALLKERKPGEVWDKNFTIKYYKSFGRYKRPAVVIRKKGRFVTFKYETKK